MFVVNNNYKRSTTCHLLSLAIIILYIHLGGTIAFCSEIYSIDNLSEKYYIDDQNVILYKVINWWYDCHSEDNLLLCGKIIRCNNLGNAYIIYNQSKFVVNISIQKGFAGQLSIFKNRHGYLGPSYLYCIWQNKKYLGTGKAASVSNINQFTFFQIDIIHAQILKKIEKKLLFILEGNILGLSSEGKIALHNTGILLKSCPDGTDKKGSIFPITVKIINVKTDEVIAKYLAIWSK